MTGGYARQNLRECSLDMQLGDESAKNRMRPSDCGLVKNPACALDLNFETALECVGSFLVRNRCSQEQKRYEFRNRSVDD